MIWRWKVSHEGNSANTVLSRGQHAANAMEMMERPSIDTVDNKTIHFQYPKFLDFRESSVWISVIFAQLILLISKLLARARAGLIPSINMIEGAGCEQSLVSCLYQQSTLTTGSNKKFSSSSSFLPSIGPLRHHSHGAFLFLEPRARIQQGDRQQRSCVTCFAAIRSTGQRDGEFPEFSLIQ